MITFFRLWLLLIFCAATLKGTGAPPAAPPGMIYIPGGDYKPLYAKASTLRKAPPCFLGTVPVTNAEFLAFVTEHPEWRRSKATRAMADTNYLRHWAGDLDLGPDTEKQKAAPVTSVSWFAARAYCESKGLRLPTQDEWEFAARADATRIDATTDQAFLHKLLEWYGKPAIGILPPVQSAEVNVYGLRGLHGLVWEWVQDFNSTMIVGDSRGDDSLERKLFCGAGSLLAGDVTNYAAYMRYAFRSSLMGTYCVSSLGFRTARSLQPDAPAPALAGSIYELRSQWLTQDTRTVTLDSLKGKVRLVTMGFTSCQYSCPRIVGDMQRIETALGSDADRTGFVFLSIDPFRDTPESITEFAKERKLNSTRWTLLSGNEAGVRDLAVVLNFKFQQVGENFAHANLIAVLDPKGNVIFRQEELDADIGPIVSAVKKALNTP